MEKFIPYEKLSKRRRKERDKQQRGSWEGIHPATRKKESAKLYNRKKKPHWSKEHPDAVFLWLECKLTHTVCGSIMMSV